MALKVLITAIDTNNTAKSFGIVGSVLLNASDVKKATAQVAVNDNATPYQKPELNSKKLVAVIDQLSIMDNLLKKKLDNQKIAYQNSKLAEQEDKIERVRQYGNINAKKKDAERVGAGGVGLLALAGLALLAYDPVMRAIKRLADFAVEAGTFIYDTVSEITKFFKDFLPDSSSEETPTETPEADTPPATPPPATSPPGDAEPVTPPPATPPPADAKPVTPPSAEGSKPGSPAAAKPESKPKDDRSWWERNAPSWAGGKSAPTSPAPPAKSDTEKQKDAEKTTTIPKNVTVQSGVNLTGVNSDLKNRVFKALAEYGEPITITSGLRTDKEQAALWVRGNIYKEKGIYTPNRPSVDTTVVVRGKTHHVKGSGRRTSHLGGEGIDIAISQVRDRRKLDSILNKYGLGRDPNGSDPVHIYKLKGGVPAPATAESPTNTQYSQQSAAEKATSKATEMLDNTLVSMAEFIGTVGGKIVGPGVARDLATSAPDFAKLISAEAAAMDAEIAKIRDAANKPTPAPIASPPNISASGSGAVQNLPTMVDRNSVQYYLSRFGYKETNTPIKAA